MATQDRKRNVQIIVRVTEDEKALIEQKMALLKTSNMSAYLRKITIDGYIKNVDHPDVKNHAVTTENAIKGVEFSQQIKIPFPALTRSDVFVCCPS